MGVSVRYSWEAIKWAENNYLFFFLVFLIIQSSFTDGVSIMICWSFILSSTTSQTEAEEIIRLHMMVSCIFNPTDKSVQSRTWPSPFSCTKCWRKVSGNRMRVCCWSPVTYYFSSIPPMFFCPVTEQRPCIHQGYAERRHFKVTAGSGGPTVAQFCETCEPHL